MRRSTEELSQLFAGNPNGYGLGGPSPLSVRVTDPGEWPSLWEGHCEGDHPIGTYCLCPGDTVRWGCIDIDTFEPRLAFDLAGVLGAMGTFPMVEISRRKGFHVWWFYERPVDAWKVRLVGLEACRRLGVTLECNPKQDSLAGLDLGNYVRTPYPRRAEEVGRQCFLNSDEMLTLAQFLRQVRLSAPGPSAHEAIRSPLCPRSRKLWFEWPTWPTGAPSATQAPQGGVVWDRIANQDAAGVVFRSQLVPIGRRDDTLFAAANLMWSMDFTEDEATEAMERICEEQMEQGPGRQHYPAGRALEKVRRVFSKRGPRTLPQPQLKW